MYGLEYSALAKVIVNQDENLDERKVNATSLKQANYSRSGSFNNGEQSPAIVMEKLLSKLHNLRKCPEYLVPKFNYTTSNISMGNMIKK